MNARSFSEYLVAEGLLQANKVAIVEQECAASGNRPDTVILDLGLVSEATLLDRLGRYSTSRIVSAAELRAAPTEVATLISPRVARRHGVVPFRRDGKTLHVAALEPGDLLIQDELGLMTGCMIVTHAVLEVRLVEALAMFFGAERSTTMVGLANRLNGGALPRKSAQRAAARTAAASPARSYTPTVEERRRERAAERREQQTLTELEMSDEDLAMFPSLAAAHFNDPQGAEPDAGVHTGSPTPESDSAPATVAEPQPLPPPPPEEPPSIEILLARAAEMMQRAEMRDDIGDALLDFTRPYLSRRLLLTIRGETIVGWRGEGPGVEPAAVRAIAIPKTEPSVFLGLVQGTAFWLGPLPPMIRNQELRVALGEPGPQSCVVLPIKVRGKIVAFLYGDREDEPLGSLPMVEFRRLLAKADVAFQVYLLKAKIRTL